MISFFKKYFRTIMFILFIGLIVGGIFLYRFIRDMNVKYEPNDGPVEYEIKKYEDNQYTVVYVDDVDVYNSYYKDYLLLMLNNPTVAYDMLTTDCRENLFNNNYKDFLKYIKSLDKDILITGSIKRYRADKKVIHIIDSFDNGYVFYENGAWNYTVSLNGRVE